MFVSITFIATLIQFVYYVKIKIVVINSIAENPCGWWETNNQRIGVFILLLGALDSAIPWWLSIFTLLFGGILDYEIAYHRTTLTLPCQTWLTGFLAKRVRNNTQKRSYSQIAVLMTKRNTILVFCTQKTPQLTWLSLQNAGVRPTPSVRVPVSQKERRCPRGKLLYCACSSRTWHTAAAFVYLSSEDHQQVITFLYLTKKKQNKRTWSARIWFRG